MQIRILLHRASTVQLVILPIAAGILEVVLVIDRHKCRKSLLELCFGLYAADFPVLVVLEIHEALCSIRGLHELDGDKSRSLRLREGHLKENVSWEIAKKVKHFL